jgi:hypothetical protein
MTAIDPLTYLDEVDAYLAIRDKFTNAGPNIVGYGDIIHGLNDVVLRVPQVRALSKALRAVLAINTGDNRTLYGNDFEAGMATKQSRPRLRSTTKEEQHDRHRPRGSEGARREGTRVCCVLPGLA